MAIQFILGGPGTGKTTSVIQQMANMKVDCPNQGSRLSSYFYVVPEQYTLKAQEKILQEVPGLLDIEVLSFNRLVYRFMDFIGLASHQMIQDTGKSMLIRRIIEDHINEFKWISKHRKKQSYMDELNKLMTECYQYDLKETLFTKGISEVKSQTLKDKLYDLSLLFKYFREEISQKYLTPHEGSLRLVSKIQGIEVFKSVAVVFDGFYGFTPLQYRMIEALMGVCPLVQFVITVDSIEGLGNLKQESDLYYESRKAISTIRDMADRMQLEELDLEFHQGIQRKYSNGIAHLSRHLYKYPIQSLQKPVKGIRLVEATNRRNELETCSLRIHQLIQTGKYRYRDIVVITSDLDQYEKEVQQIFADYEIPVFIDKKESIQSHPLSHWILSALRTIRYNFRLEDVMSHLKSLYNAEDHQVQNLEVACIQKGINGYKKWVNFIDKYQSEMPLSMLAVMDFKEKMKSARTVKAKCHILYDYMKQCKVYETHVNIGQGEIEKAKLQEGLVFVKVYEKVVEMLDELVNMLGEEFIALEDYISLIESGLNSIQFAVTPASVDQVLIGDLRRTRFNEVSVVFVLGVNEGKVPYVQNSQQLMSDAERLQLLKAGIEMAPTKQRSLFKEQMNIFMALCKAKTLLHISYVKGDYEGNLRPAALILMLRKLFPELSLEKGYQIIQEAEDYFKINPTFSQLIEDLQSNSYAKWENQLNTLYFYMVKAYNKYGLLKVNPLSIERGISYVNDTPELVKVGERFESTHISKLESYASCSYKYYLDYILKVKDLEPYEITLPDIGNLFHQCLEIYVRQCIRKGIDVGHVKDQVRHELIQEAVETVLSKIHEGVFFSSYRYQYLAVKLTRIMKRAVWGIEKQFATSLFRPKESEYQFNGQAFPTESLKIKIDEDRYVYLKGVIDRVDEYTDETKHYVSVTDYKSGDKNLDLNMIYEGLNMQLTVYLKVAKEIKENQYPDKEVVPAGMTYYQMKDPLVKMDDGMISDERIEAELLKKLRPKGLILEDEQVIRMFDQKIQGTSKTVPVSLTGKGISSRSSTIKADDLETVFDYVGQKIAHISQKMYRGEVQIHPINYDGKAPCEYCKYRSVCRFDPTINNENYRHIIKRESEEILNNMKSSNDKS